MTIEIELAGISLRIELRLEGTRRYFEKYIVREDCENWDIRVEDEDIPLFPLICPKGVLDPFSEAYLLMPRVSAFLLGYNRILIHGVSFVWHGRSWLLTAQSGVGKTTQLRLWQKLFSNEIEVINGDKSILEYRDDGSFWLHPSPWTGKEKDAGTASAPLAGIVVLRQSHQNVIRLISPRESVLEIFQQFLNTCDTPSEVHAIEALESKLLETVPVWLLENLGNEESARMTYQAFSEYEDKTNENV